MKYHCPFCDYTDPERESVEAHISGSTNSHHAGKVGRMYRSDIEETGEPESFTEQLFGDSGKEQARITEIEKVKERNQALKSKVEELGRQIQELQDRLDGGKTGREETIEDEIKKMDNRLTGTERAIWSIDHLFKELFRNRESTRRIERMAETIECESCNVEVKLSYDSVNDRLYCPNCHSRPMKSHLSNAKPIRPR